MRANHSANLQALSQSLSRACDAAGCENSPSISCPHGRYCLTHAREHGESDEACDKAIDYAMAVVFADGFKPLLSTLKAIRKIDTAKIEREIFPIRECFLDVIKALNETHERVIEILQIKLEECMAYLRERFEGNPMPYELSDDEVWEWYKRYVSEDDEEN